MRFHAPYLRIGLPFVAFAFAESFALHFTQQGFLIKNPHGKLVVSFRE